MRTPGLMRLLLICAVVITGVAVGCGDDVTDGGGNGGGRDKKEQAAKQKPAGQEKPPAEEEPEVTSGQENALQAGQNYVDTLPFSKEGLIQQLSSSAGDGYSKADATFAANNVDADWKAEAVEAAQNYLDTIPMSKDGLIQQLSSAAGDKFTPAQARYAANKVY